MPTSSMTKTASKAGTLWQRLGFAGKRKQDLLAGQFVVLAKHRFVTGATVMFRAVLRDRCLPVCRGLDSR